MLLAVLAILLGFIVLVWSADRFVDGAASTASLAGMPALLIGMVIVGFGTSAPEMVVSAMASIDGNPELALGNAIGSNIVNTSLVLGATALISPIVVHSKVVRKELPLVLGIGLIVGYFLWDFSLTRPESSVLILGLVGLIGWSIFSALRSQGDTFETEIEKELEVQKMSLSQSIFWLVFGLTLLIISSKVLVWGAVYIAQALGISDLVIGLTIVALGTSLPELAASIIAARKSEHDIALGNIVGSNMFNLLAVIGIAGVISPIPDITKELMVRDWPTMMAMMTALMLMAIGFRGHGRINRWEGFVLLFSFFAYNAYLILSIT